MNGVNLERLYNCSASILDQDITYMLGLNRTELFNVLDDVLVRSTKREILRAAFTDCLIEGQQRPFDLPWWQKLTWSMVFAAILLVATGGNIIVMWIVLGKYTIDYSVLSCREKRRV